MSDHDDRYDNEAYMKLIFVPVDKPRIIYSICMIISKLLFLVYVWDGSEPNSSIR